MFEHAYIIHSTIYPSILNITNTLNKEKSQQLEELLADLPLMVKSNQNSTLISNEISRIKNNIQYFYSKIQDSYSTKEYQLISSQTISQLLNDAKVSYDMYVNSSKSSDNNLKHLGVIDYENSLSLVNKSNLIYNSFKPEMHNDLIQKIDPLLTNLKNLILSKSNNINNFTNNVLLIQNSLTEFDESISSSISTNNNNNSYKIYFDNIQNLLNKAILSIKNENNYQNATDYVTTAYLDNFEYLEPPIEKINATLKGYTEISMREQLRALIDSHAPLLQIENLITKINNSLTEEEEKLLSSKSVPNILGDSNSFSKSNNLINGTDINALKVRFWCLYRRKKSNG